jgi:hypothetical protein
VPGTRAPVVETVPVKETARPVVAPVGFDVDNVVKLTAPTLPEVVSFWEKLALASGVTEFVFGADWAIAAPVTFSV